MHNGRMLRRLVPALLAISVLVGCAPRPQSDADPTPTADTSAAETPTATPTPQVPLGLRLNVDDGATDVSVGTEVSATVTGGTIKKMAVTGDQGDVPGAANAEKTEWAALEGLDPSSAYRVTAVAVDAQGHEKRATASFTTASLTLDQQTFPTLTPVHSAVYGQAMPIIITFDVPVTDRASIERHLHVTSEPKQEGTWGWISDTEVRYRPKEYWQPGTKVTLDARLNGVDAGNGIHGQESRQVSFEIGSASEATVDLQAKTMTITADGRTTTLPISAGNADHPTRNGTKVISEKFDQLDMNSGSVGIDPASSDGYDLSGVQYAMRVTQSGEFIHAAPWNEGLFGEENASHGCVGLSTADADRAFTLLKVGDPVTFTGGTRELEPGNGFSDFNESWETFAERSAL